MTRIAELQDRLHRLAKRREDEGIYTDANLVETASSRIVELEAEVDMMAKALKAANERAEALSRTGAVKVKGLEWVFGETKPSPDLSVWIADAPGLNETYSVWHSTNPDAVAPYSVPKIHNGFYNSLDEAKAAAQADYERRILSALEPAEPVDSDGTLCQLDDPAQVAEELGLPGAPETRACTCHPNDNPPDPCAQKFAYSDCVAAAPEGQQPVAASFGWKCNNCTTIFTSTQEHRRAGDRNGGPPCPHCKAFGQFTYRYELHSGDPCVKCGAPHDDVPAGSCVPRPSEQAEPEGQQEPVTTVYEPYPGAFDGILGPDTRPSEQAVTEEWRLIERGEIIQWDDEVIADDAASWVAVDRWAIGCQYHTAFKSIRRRTPLKAAMEAGR